MTRIKDNRIFFDNQKWQRFIHFIYINDMSNNLFENNCEDTVNKALRYANLSRYLVKTNVTTVINPLKSDYLEVFKNNINKLKSLQDQNSESIETAVAEFDAPLLYNRLKLWTPIFNKWKDIYTNPKSDVYNVIYNSIQIILNNQEKKNSVSKFALNLGLKNPSDEMYKKLANSLQCKHFDNIRILLKQIILEEVTIRCPYERGNGKFLFVTDYALKSYSDNWDLSYLLSSSNVRKSLYKPLINVLKNTEHSQLITDNECIFKNEDSVATSSRNMCLTKSRKRKMSNLSLNHDDEIDNKSPKRRKLSSTETLISIISERNENQEKDSFCNNDLSEVIFYGEESDINNNSETRLMYSEGTTAKEERKNMLAQIKEHQYQKNLCNEDMKQLHLQLEKNKKIIDELIVDRDSRIEEIQKLEEELQNQETLKVFEELRLRSELESARKINCELTNKQERMFVEINVLQKELEKIRERVEKVHQEKTEKSEETSHVCCIT